MSRQMELPQLSRGEAPRVERSEEAPTETHGDERSGTSGLLELALSRENLQAALKRVRKNKGSPGIDGMTVDELPDHLRAHWSELREHLLSGAYRPSMVKQQLIPKGHRLRAIHLKHWKRGTTIFRELRARGLPETAAARVAGNGRRWWRNSAMLINRAFPISYFDQLGVPRLAS